MTKICRTCKAVNKLNNITSKDKKQKLSKRDLNYLFPPNFKPPKLQDIKVKKPSYYNTQDSLNLKKKNAGKYVVYYASNLTIECGKVPLNKDSYKNMDNYGVAKLDKEGKCNIYLKCPNIYREKNRTYYPHVHFVLSNSANTQWVKKLYTKTIICHINKSELKQAIKNNCTVILNALSLKYYIKNRIPNSYSLPYTLLKELENKDIIHYIKSLVSNYPRLHKLVKEKKLDILDIPIITYCYDETCDASKQLVEHLIKIGFKNIKEYSYGIMGWEKS